MKRKKTFVLQFRLSFFTRQKGNLDDFSNNKKQKETKQNQMLFSDIKLDAE